MYSERLEYLMNAAVADGQLTDKEREILMRNARAEGVDLDEFEMVLDAALFERKRVLEVEAKQNEAPVTVTPPPAPAAEVQQPVVAQAVEEAPKPSNKMGDIKKCPNCGATIVGHQAKCRECGFEFTNVQALTSVQQLAQKMEEIADFFRRKEYKDKSGFLVSESADEQRMEETYNAQASCVRTFPIPLAKADLFEFALAMWNGYKSLDDSFTGAYLCDAYKAKHRECISKIEAFFPDDPLFKPILEQARAKKGFFNKLFD